MTTQLMFYDSAVPVSSKRHVGLSVKAGEQYDFARKVSSVPLTAAEMRPAAAEYVVVFAGQGETVMPVVILGVEANQNLYVKDDGGWDSTYVPAFVRRYPFVFAASQDGKSFTLCIDEAFSGCNREGRGEQLFDIEGVRTQYLETVLNFVKGYQVQHQRTQALCKRLVELGLLEPVQVRFTLPGGVRRGFERAFRQSGADAPLPRRLVPSENELDGHSSERHPGLDPGSGSGRRPDSAGMTITCYNIGAAII